MERERPRPEERALPTPLEVRFDTIPETLKERPQWVVWNYQMVEDDIKKPPFSPRTGKQAKVTDARTWGSFQEAKRAYETGVYAGVGFVLTSGIVGIDIDHCLAGAQCTPEAR